MHKKRYLCISDYILNNCLFKNINLLINNLDVNNIQIIKNTKVIVKYKKNGENYEQIYELL